jgi:hypothetical protein
VFIATKTGTVNMENHAGPTMHVHNPRDCPEKFSFNAKRVIDYYL